MQVKLFACILQVKYNIQYCKYKCGERAMVRRSDCPIANVLDLVGDKWSLLLLRDLLFFNKQTYSELQHSDEKIATNILSSRLEQLETSGLISKQQDQRDKRKKVYTLTRAGKDMMPILLEMIAWSAKYDKQTNAPKDLVERIANDRAQLIAQLSLD
jgi:DNA-binding HxlR family transcriptional regulator